MFVFVVPKLIAHKMDIVSQKGQTKNGINIAGRLPENSRNRFVDRQSKKNSKKDRPKKFVFSLKADLLYFD